MSTGFIIVFSVWISLCQRGWTVLLSPILLCKTAQAPSHRGFEWTVKLQILACIGSSGSLSCWKTNPLQSAPGFPPKLLHSSQPSRVSCRKASPQNGVATTTLHSWNAMFMTMCSVTWHLVLWPKSYILVSPDHRINSSSWLQSPLCLLANCRWDVMRCFKSSFLFATLS